MRQNRQAWACGADRCPVLGAPRGFAVHDDPKVRDSRLAIRAVHPPCLIELFLARSAPNESPRRGGALRSSAGSAPASVPSEKDTRACRTRQRRLAAKPDTYSAHSRRRGVQAPLALSLSDAPPPRPKGRAGQTAREPPAAPAGWTAQAARPAVKRADRNRPALWQSAVRTLPWRLANQGFVPVRASSRHCMAGWARKTFQWVSVS